MTHDLVNKRSRHASVEDSADLLPPPPDGGWGWVVVFASFMIHVINDGVTYTFGLFFLEFLRYFEEGHGATAWIASILVGVTLCSGPISSSFVNRYGCRSVTIAGGILASICLALSVLATNVVTLYVTIGVGAGLGFGLIYLPAIVSVTCYFDKKRSFATGIAVCGSGLGTFLFAPVTEWLIEEYRWQGAMLIISAIVLNCVVFGALFRPVEPPKDWRSKSMETGVEKTACNGETDMEPRACTANTNLLVEVRKNNSDHNLHLTAIAPHTNGIQRNLSAGNFPSPIACSNKKGFGLVSPEGKYSDVARLALSQPVLISGQDGESCVPRFVFGSQGLRGTSTTTSGGLMYRPDIFYRGSLVNIPQYRSNPRLFQDLMTRKPDEKREDDMMTTVCGCVPCSPETRDTLREMLDMSLLKDYIFILFVISNFCTSVGFNVPYVYIVARAESLGIESDYASYLLSVIGIANTVGRVILGYLSDKPWINRLYVYNICLTVCGVGTAFSAFCFDYTSLVVYAAVFGFTIGAYVGLTSVILVDLLGLDKLTNAFGLLLLFQGIASFIGPPIAGWLYDALGSYDPGFCVAGVTIAASGIMLFLIPPIQRWLDNRSFNPRTASNGCVIQDL